jgi:hypothetical protein
MVEVFTDHVEELSDEPQTTMQDKSEKGDTCKDVLPDAEYSHINHPSRGDLSTGFLADIASPG